MSVRLKAEAIMEAEGIKEPLQSHHQIFANHKSMWIYANKGKWVKYPVTELRAVSSADKYNEVITKDSKFLVITSLKKLVTQLPPRFMVINNNALIDLDAVIKVDRDIREDTTQVTLLNVDRKFTVSRRNRPEFSRRIKTAKMSIRLLCKNAVARGKVNIF